ncbi:MAG: sugar phosphate isomerase/epimerase [Bryobacterales bacterium]|nr:sugar phosphate isomerase/epimerase [Bryobacterales bacterium]
MHRREFLAASAMVAPTVALAQSSAEAPTRFQLACMTLPYSAFPLETALRGIKAAGYRFVAWGVNHSEGPDARRPAMPLDAPPAQAKALAARCRNMGLEPVMMFSAVNFEEAGAADAYRKRIDQAQAAGIESIIVFGKTTRGGYGDVVRNLKTAATHAEGTAVKLLIKQHGGNTATGADCSRIIADVAHPSVSMCYDAGNVLDYENHDPIPDIQACWKDVRAFSIKDHRNFPVDQDCGAGFGEIDHYKLLLPVMRTGLTMPLATENISEPLVPRPTTPEGVNRLARRSREYLESVLAGLERHLSTPA